MASRAATTASRSRPSDDIIQAHSVHSLSFFQFSWVARSRADTAASSSPRSRNRPCGWAEPVRGLSDHGYSVTRAGAAGPAPADTPLIRPMNLTLALSSPSQAGFLRHLAKPRSLEVLEGTLADVPFQWSGSERLDGNT
jgi:hypothetical protein